MAMLKTFAKLPDSQAQYAHRMVHTAGASVRSVARALGVSRGVIERAINHVGEAQLFEAVNDELEGIDLERRRRRAC
jgi:transposase-like protein